MIGGGCPEDGTNNISKVVQSSIKRVDILLQTIFKPAVPDSVAHFATMYHNDTSLEQ